MGADSLDSELDVRRNLELDRPAARRRSTAHPPRAGRRSESVSTSPMTLGRADAAGHSERPSPRVPRLSISNRARKAWVRDACAIRFSPSTRAVAAHPAEASQRVPQAHPPAAIHAVSRLRVCVSAPLTGATSLDRSHVCHYGCDVTLPVHKCCWGCVTTQRLHGNRRSVDLQQPRLRRVVIADHPRVV